MTQLSLFASSPPVASPAVTMWVGEYDVKKKNQRHFRYLRFYWIEGGQTHHVHLPGGQANSPKMHQRRTEVEGWMRSGWSVAEIRRAIAQWSEGQGSNLNKNKYLR